MGNFLVATAQAEPDIYQLNRRKLETMLPVL